MARGTAWQECEPTGAGHHDYTLLALATDASQTKPAAADVKVKSQLQARAVELMRAAAIIHLARAQQPPSLVMASAGQALHLLICRCTHQVTLLSLTMSVTCLLAAPGSAHCAAAHFSSDAALGRGHRQRASLVALALEVH